jgi:beta-lactam-binding protein with PASTA domain
LRPCFGHCPRIADENDTTAPHAPIGDTEAHPAVAPPAPDPPPAGPPPPDAGPPPGMVNDVWPWLAALGALAVIGLLVWLFVFRDTSKGKIVPAVVGMQQQQAIQELTNEGFGVQAIVGPSAKPKGIVFAQKPGGGSRLDKGQTVVIDVSNGNAVTPTTTATTTATTQQQTTTQKTTTQKTTTTTAPATASVPDVTGQTASDAAGQLEAAGFVAQTDPVEQSGTPGSVAGQDPGGNSQAPAGSVIRLSVAVGSDRPAQEVPNVVGQQAAAARAALLDAKLTVKTEYRKDAKSRGTVLAQSSAAGGSQPAYTQVTITVGE